MKFLKTAQIHSELFGWPSNSLSQFSGVQLGNTNTKKDWVNSVKRNWFIHFSFFRRSGAWVSGLRQCFAASIVGFEVGSHLAFLNFQNLSKCLKINIIQSWWLDSPLLFDLQEFSNSSFRLFHSFFGTRLACHFLFYQHASVSELMQTPVEGKVESTVSMEREDPKNESLSNASRQRPVV